MPARSPMKMILPRSARVAEQFGDADQPPHPSEMVHVERAMPVRRRSFANGRACAHRALALLGVPDEPVGVGPLGEPRWPTDVVGSITHCDGYSACAVAWENEILALGIDAEPNASVSSAVLEGITGGDERHAIVALMRREPAIAWDRLLFTAKESAYKMWSSRTGRSAWFTDASIRLRHMCSDGDVHTGAFDVVTALPLPWSQRTASNTVQGAWLADPGLLVACAFVRSRNAT